MPAMLFRASRFDGLTARQKQRAFFFKAAGPQVPEVPSGSELSQYQVRHSSVDDAPNRHDPDQMMLHIPELSCSGISHLVTAG